MVEPVAACVEAHPQELSRQSWCQTQLDDHPAPRRARRGFVPSSHLMKNASRGALPLRAPRLYRSMKHDQLPRQANPESDHWAQRRPRPLPAKSGGRRS